MKISQLLLGTLLVCVSPVTAQTEQKPSNNLPYPVVSTEEIMKLVDLKTIKLHLRDTTLKQALEELTKQTGVGIDTRFDNGGALAKKLSLDIETESFKEATNAIFEEAGIKASLQDFGLGRRLGIQWSEDLEQGKDAPVSGTKRFPIKLISLSTSQSKNLHMAKKPILNQYTSSRVNLLPIIDPRFALLSVANEITRIEDNQGNLLQISSGTSFSETPNALKILGMGVPEKDTRFISRMEGTSTYIFVAKRERWELPDVLSAHDTGHDFQVGDIKVHLSIENARKTDDGVEIAIKVKELTPTKGPFDGLRHPLMQFKQLVASLSMLDANGQALENGGFSGGGGNELNGRIRYYVPQPSPPQPDAQPLPPVTFAEPLKLIINSPSQLVQVQVPFSFENVPLP